MRTTESKQGQQRSWMIGLAVLSLVMPAAAVFPLADPANLSGYRLTVAALVLGMAFAGGALLVNRAVAPSWVRWLGLGLASLGLLYSIYLLWILIGSCGLQVIWSACQP